MRYRNKTPLGFSVQRVGSSFQPILKKNLLRFRRRSCVMLNLLIRHFVTRQENVNLPPLFFGHHQKRSQWYQAPVQHWVSRWSDAPHRQQLSRLTRRWVTCEIDSLKQIYAIRGSSKSKIIALSPSSRTISPRWLEWPIFTWIKFNLLSVSGTPEKKQAQICYHIPIRSQMHPLVFLQQ